VKKSVAQLANEIEYIHDHMDNDERHICQGSANSAPVIRETLDVSILRHSIAAAIGGTVPSNHVRNGADSEVLQFASAPVKAPPEEEDEVDAIPESKESHAKERRPRSSEDRSMHTDDLLSRSRNRSSLSRTTELRNPRYASSPEHARAILASERARRILESPYLTKGIDPIPNEMEIQSFSKSCSTHRRGGIDIKRIPGVADHIDRRRKPPRKRVAEPEVVILPNPPSVTPSFIKVSGILTTEISEILERVNEDVPM
jgi:hypothetical protein